MATLVGGSGDDVLLGSETDATELYGDGGDDRLESRGGLIRVHGGGGSDTMIGSPQIGDIVLYDTSGRGVSVTLDGRRNDGAPGERDLVSEIEDFIGSPYDDIFVGDEGPNWAWGARGYDRLYGRGGADELLADYDGGLLHGGPGPDFLSSFGASRTTRIEAVDGDADAVRCITGAIVRVDAVDDSAGCSPPVFVLRSGMAVAAGPERARVSARGFGRIGLILAGPRRSAEGKIELTRRGVTIGRGRFALQAYKWRRTRFRLTRQGLFTLRQTRPLRVRLSFSGVDDQGDSISARDRLTLRFRRRQR